MVGFGRRVGDSRDIRRRFFSLPVLLSLAVAGGFLAFLITRFDVDLSDTWGQVKGANIWLLAAAVAVHYTTFIFRGARWRLLLENTQEPGAPLPGVLYCGQLVLLGWFVNTVAGFQLGVAYRAYLYRDEQDASFSRTIGTILAERMLDLVLVVVLVVVAAPFLVKSGGGAAWTVLVVAALVVVLLAGAVAVMMWARAWALRKLPTWLAERYSRFHQGTLGSFQRIVPVTLLGFLAWMAEVARLYLVVQALGLDIGIPLVVVLVMANSLLSVVPTPGGIGAVEPGVAGLAKGLSSRLSDSVILALVVVDRAITYLSIILVGTLIFLGRQAMRRPRAVKQVVGVGRVEEL